MGKVVWKPGTMLYPVPAVMITTRWGEINNIITVSWAGTICTNPPMVSISIRPERYSYELLKQSGEFVINVPGKDLTFATDFCGVRSGRDVNKFDFLKLERDKASIVNAPLIKSAPLALECRVKDVVELGSHHLFIADVVAVDVDEALIDASGKLHLEKADLIAYNHGHYCIMSEIVGSFGFSVKRGVRHEPSQVEPGVSSRKPEQEARPTAPTAQSTHTQVTKKPGTHPAKKGYKNHKGSKNS